MDPAENEEAALILFYLQCKRFVKPGGFQGLRTACAAAGLCAFFLLYLSETGFSQSYHKGTAVLRVPVAGGELNEAFVLVDQFFQEGRLEDGHRILRRLLEEGTNSLYQISKNRIHQ